MSWFLKFAQLIGKSVIKVSESPGNISTRLIVTLINEACETLMEGVASVDDIDDTMKRGFGLQFGPFEMADQIGLDKMLKWMNNLYEEFGEHKFKPSPILKRLVRANYNGISTGEDSIYMIKMKSKVWVLNFLKLNKQALYYEDNRFKLWQFLYKIPGFQYASERGIVQRIC